eukprot:CAMPEP_0118937962 /NCGR_PEP_ID=MMETSP1169-20130426/24393_1 /TAXON_ID=36882 /ORGANISM="Pyramimonas obovata, Strain CCMP722" /LENGTH=161 /DNA_ID=CAMNT_0006881761 /DNA_START=280 /DNA_END=765 /DNA_ORIENTATION=+
MSDDRNALAAALSAHVPQHELLREVHEQPRLLLVQVVPGVQLVRLELRRSVKLDSLLNPLCHHHVLAPRGYHHWAHDLRHLLGDVPVVLLRDNGPQERLQPVLPPLLLQRLDIAVDGVCGHFVAVCKGIFYKPWSQAGNKAGKQILDVVLAAIEQKQHALP